MKITRMSLYRVRIPFRRKFRHSTHERESTDNIILKTELEDGSVGYGEGLARTYVTGETPDDVVASIQNLNPTVFARPFQNFEQVIDFLETEILSLKNFTLDRPNNTARCVVELSLLDAFCQSFKKGFYHVQSKILGKDNRLRQAPQVYYSGVLSMENFRKTSRSAIKMKIFGFPKVKLKIDANINHAMEKISLVRKILGPRIDLRVDVNGAWSLPTAIAMSQRLKQFNITALEQPLPHSDLMAMKELKQKSPIPLMIDESLCTLKDAETAIENNLCDLFNIRLSKCGGFINSLKIAQLARKNGMGYQLGCMVGETGILSAAGRHFAILDPNLRYLEGSYDRFLLKKNIVKEKLTFKRKGRANGLTGYGLGIHVKERKLKKYSTDPLIIFKIDS